MWPRVTCCMMWDGRSLWHMVWLFQITWCEMDSHWTRDVTLCFRLHGVRWTVIYGTAWPLTCWCCVKVWPRSFRSFACGRCRSRRKWYSAPRGNCHLPKCLEPCQEWPLPFSRLASCPSTAGHCALLSTHNIHRRWAKWHLHVRVHARAILCTHAHFHTHMHSYSGTYNSPQFCTCKIVYSFAQALQACMLAYTRYTHTECAHIPTHLRLNSTVCFTWMLKLCNL